MGILTSSLTGERSSSRSFMWFYTGIATTICVGVMIFILVNQLGIYKNGVEWEPLEGPMDWLKNLVFAGVLTFLGNEAANAYAKRGPSETDIDVKVQGDVKRS